MHGPSIDELLEEIKKLEQKVANAASERSKDFKYKIVEGKAVFEKEIQKQHKKLKTNIVIYLVSSPLGSYLVAPIIYSMLAPAIIMDLFITIYQFICFPVYGIKKVKRNEYIILDRGKLKYLNLLEKMNCTYCGYFNGLIGYVREIAARTEQYFCPIKHAKHPRGHHRRYHQYQNYGDPENLERRLYKLRAKLAPHKNQK